MALQHLRSGTAHKRPIPSVMSAGQLAINTNEASPGLFFKDSNGDLVKVGPVHIGTDAPNSSPASVAATALVTGTVYQILTVGTSDFTLVGASANTVGTIFTATGTTTGDGTVSGQQGVEKGEQWLDTTGGTYVLKIYDGTAWRSESGTFVDVNGDTMTGSLILPSGTAAAPALGVGSTDNGLYSPGTDQVAISTNGAGRLFINSSGNVGIGTTSPTVLLDLESTSPTIRLTDSDATGTPECQISGAGGDLVLEADRDNEKSDSLIRFLVDGSDAMRIRSDGNIGIGNTAPGAKLQIEGTSDQLKLTYTSIASYIHEVHSNGDYSIAKDSSERLRIDSSGNVGIGTASPDTLLDVSSSDNTYVTVQSTANDKNALTYYKTGQVASSGFYVGLNASEEAMVWQTENNVIRFGTNNTDAMRIDSSGRVGIGATSPQHSLQINATNPRIRLQETSTGGEKRLEMWVDPSDSVGYIGANQSAQQLAFQTASTNRILITNAGDVGIGTTSPAAKLHVENGDVRLENDTKVTIGFRGHTTGSTDLAFRDANAGVDRMTIDSSGNVGIGASSPTELLQLEATDNPKIRFVDAGNYEYKLGITSNNKFSLLRSGSDTETITADSSGNVGIGTSSPAQRLEVKGAGFIASQISGDSTNETQLRFATNTAARVSNQANTALIFDTNATERMRIDSTGRLLVNTSSSRTNLVNGTLNAQLQVEGVNHSASSASLIRNSADANNAFLTLGKTRGTANGSNTIVQDGDGLGHLAFLGADGTNLIRAAEIFAQVDGTPGLNDMPGRLVFAVTSDGESSPTERMRLTSNGNFGIRTSNPIVPLHVIGDQRFEGDMVVAPPSTSTEGGQIALRNPGGSTTGATLDVSSSDVVRLYQLNNNSVMELGQLAGTGGFIKFVTEASERLRIASNGNVGIGTSSPQYPLDVAGNIRFGSSTGYAFIQYGLDSTTTDNWHIGSEGDGSFRFYNGNLGAGTERMRITSGGSLGIGTSAPSSILHTQGSRDYTGSTPNTNSYDINFQSGTAFVAIGQSNGIPAIQGHGAGTSYNLALAPNNGKVGIGTTSPLYALHVENSTDASASFTVTDKGELRLIPASDADGHAIRFGGGSAGTTEPRILRFITSGNAERARFDSSGSLLLHTTTNYPGAGNTATGAMFEKAGGGTTLFVSRGDNTTAFFNRNSDGTLITMRRSGSEVGTISVTTTATAYNTSSDYRLKENVVNLDGAIDRVKQLAPKRFNFIADADTTVDGFLAHEAQTVVPEAVTGTHNEVDDDGNAVMQGIDQSKLVPLLTAALQEAIAKIETLEQRLTDAGL